MRNQLPTIAGFFILASGAMAQHRVTITPLGGSTAYLETSPGCVFPGRNVNEAAGTFLASMNNQGTLSAQNMDFNLVGLGLGPFARGHFNDPLSLVEGGGGYVKDGTTVFEDLAGCTGTKINVGTKSTFFLMGKKSKQLVLHLERIFVGSGPNRHFEDFTLESDNFAFPAIGSTPVAGDVTVRFTVIHNHTGPGGSTTVTLGSITLSFRLSIAPA